MLLDQTHRSLLLLLMEKTWVRSCDHVWIQYHVARTVTKRQPLIRVLKLSLARFSNTHRQYRYGYEYS
jgi:hypothetical protein